MDSLRHAIARGVYTRVPACSRSPPPLRVSPHTSDAFVSLPVVSPSPSTPLMVVPASSSTPMHPFLSRRSGQRMPDMSRTALITSRRGLHTPSSESPSASPISGSAPSLLATWLARRQHEPTPAWLAHVPARRAAPDSTLDMATRAPGDVAANELDTPQGKAPARTRPAHSGGDLVRWETAHEVGTDVHATPEQTVPYTGYVPLLYRDGVLSPGSRVHLAALPAGLQAASTASPSTTITDTAELSPSDALHARTEAGEEDEDVELTTLAEVSSLSSSPADVVVTTPARRASSRLILDPVQWLAQDMDAPLMEAELLQSHITPSAFAGMSAIYHMWEQQRADDGDVYRPLPSSGTLFGETEEIGHGLSALEDQLTKAAAAAHEHTDDAAAAVELGEAKDEDVTNAISVDVLMQATRQAVEATPSTLTDAPLAAQRAMEAEQGTGPSHVDKDDDDALIRHHPNEEDSLAMTASSAVADVLPPPPPPVMVYNVFTGRIAQSTSAGIRSLSLLGIGVNAETRQLTVHDASAVALFAQELRAERLSWPKSWSRGVLFRRVKALLANDAILDPAVQLEAILQQQYGRVQRRQQESGGVIVVGENPDTTDAFAASSPTTSSNAASASPLSIGGASRASELLTLGDLNEEQQKVVAFVKQGYHTYIGGGAGTGKSVLLRVLRQELLKEGLTVAMTGTTGMAGWHVGGCTLHHCFGINIFGEFTRRKELAAYDVLVIDEVSMLSRQLFESLEYQLRRANGVDLPFGGVQVVLCGDFLQLGAIAAQPIVNSPIFRANFSMLKLKTVIRQDQHQLFSRQLEVLRRGKIPEGLQNTVQFLTAEEVLLAKEAERQRSVLQLQQLRQVIEQLPVPGASINAEGTEATTGQAHLLQQVTDKEESLRHVEAVEQSAAEMLPSAEAAVPAPHVPDAVNLLPTNAQVEVRNQLELMKLKGDEMSFPALVMPPTTLGTWTPTCLLRISPSTSTPDPSMMTARAAAALEKRLLAAVEQYLARFFLARPARPSSLSGTPGAAESPEGKPDADEVRLQRAATSWLSTLMTGARNIVLYRLFTDAFVLRVRLPAEVCEMDAQAFVAHFQDMDVALLAAQPELGVRVREWLPSADGLHTEQDEFTLAQYASRSPMSRGVQLKIGARVMLRTNLGPRHVNGSLGTVVGFRTLRLDDLPRYLLQTPQREEAVQAYVDFLQLEHGLEEAVVPEVDFGDGHVEAVPPVAFYVGGHANTHQYSVGIVALPLTLAYAFTVHKVQGLTLVGRVHLELSRMWPCEHLLYVAMSRVRNPEQLSVSSFSPRLVQASPECVVFDDSIPEVDAVKVLPAFVQATWRRAPSRRKRVVRRKQLEAAQRKKQQKEKEQQQQQQQHGDLLGPSARANKPRWRKADMEKEIQRIQEQLLASQHESGGT